MIATHRVKDDNKTVGFMIDGSFFTDYYIAQNIDLIDNLSITKRGVLRGKKELPIIQYKSVMSDIYSRLVVKNPFVRDIQEELIKWRREGSQQVIQLDGARQIGKTTELLKFAYSSYKYVIYVNIAGDSFDFIGRVINQGNDKIAMERYCREAHLMSFVNDRNTLIILDEIQANSKVYNLIRELRNNLRCDLIITGSYLGRIIGDDKYFIAAGTIKKVTMFPLSFKEFCRVYKADKLLEEISLYGESKKEEYKKLEVLYETYRKIGGYPESVKAFKRTRNIDESMGVIETLLDIFEMESSKYFGDIRETEIFTTVYKEAIKEMCIEKRGTGGKYIDTVVKIANASNHQQRIVSREEVLRAIVWLMRAGIIGTCDMYVDGNTNNSVSSRRTYYIDCGIANYVAYKADLEESNREGLLTETFAYGEIYRICKKEYKESVTKESVPCFSTYGNYELDFMIKGKDNQVYGIEVKTNKGDPKSLKVYLEKRLVSRGIVAKKTQGGKGDKFDTIPIYTIGERFPYKREE